MPKDKSVKKMKRQQAEAPEGGAAETAANSFAPFELDERLAKAIAEMGWEVPTRVQAAMIPLALEEKNILARARTGSGKTAAFLLPVIQQVIQLTTNSSERGPYALLIAPTKELADQIYKTLLQLTKSFSFLQCINFAHFTDEAPDDILKQVVDIAVATPGRILSALKHNPRLLNNTRHVVLDEADLLLSYGYKEDIQKLKSALPARYQTIMTSATLSEDMSELKSLFFVGPITSLKLNEGDLPGVDQLSQYHIFCNNDEERFSILLSLIKLKLLIGKSVIFVSTTDRCYRLHLFFETFAIPSCVLNSQMPANYRCRIINEFNEFNEGKHPYIIASECNDIFDEGEGDDLQQEDSADPKAAKTKKRKMRDQKKGKKRSVDKESGIGRGIDFHYVSNVINFDFPTSTDMYVHRVGRTARGWNKGTAISFAVPSERPIFESIQRRINQQMGQNALQPYEVRLKDFESFQLRAREALAACTKTVIREARMAEIRQEVLKSKQLVAYFAKNPREKQALEQEKKKHKINVHSVAIADVPDYIVPKPLRGQNFRLPKKSHVKPGVRKRKRAEKQLTTGQKKHEKKMKDPLQSYTF